MSRPDVVELLFGNKFEGTTMVFTPVEIAKDMIDMLPEDFWTPDKKILDIYTKTGRFLKQAYDKLFHSPYLEYLPPAERKQHILKNQLYGICGDGTAMLLAQRLVYGVVQLEPCNIIYLQNYEKMVNNKDQRFFMKH